MEDQKTFASKIGSRRLDPKAGARLAPVSQPHSHRRTTSRGGSLLTAAACLLLLLAAAQGYVSFRAQYTFIDHTKHTRIPSTLEALGLDTGAVIFALLALSLARRGQPAAVERVLNVACALGSMTMNLLAANLTSPRSVTVWVMPSVLYAFASDRLIAVVRRWVRASEPDSQIVKERSPWRSLGNLVLWVTRLVLDPFGTVTGFRRWVLVVVPVAPGPEATRVIGNQPKALEAGDGSVPGETKREALIRLYEQRGRAHDPRYGNPAKVAQLAGELAAEIGYHAGTARRELARYLANGHAGTDLHETTGSDTEAVA